MVSNHETADDVELEYSENNYWVEMYEALQELQEQPSFKKVIEEGYFKDKAVNGVSLLATDYVRHNGMRGNIMEELVAISALENYFQTIVNKGAPVDDDELE